jgi:hypothetical protein
MNIQHHIQTEPQAQPVEKAAGFYRPIDFPPIFSDAQRMRAVATLARQHFNAPSEIALLPR